MYKIINTTAGGNVNWPNLFGNNMKNPQKLEIELPGDPAISLLKIYPKDPNTQCRKDICTPIFIFINNN